MFYKHVYFCVNAWFSPRQPTPHRRRRSLSVRPVRPSSSIRRRRPPANPKTLQVFRKVANKQLPQIWTIVIQRSATNSAEIMV